MTPDGEASRVGCIREDSVEGDRLDGGGGGGGEEASSEAVSSRL